MSTNRTAALALVTGSIAGLVTMALHPTGHDVVRNASSGASNTFTMAVHALALIAQPLVLSGTLVLPLRLDARRDIAVGACVFFALATVAVTIAAIASGFLAPAVLVGLDQANESTRTTMMNALHLTGVVNQTFASVYVIFSSIAILLWSVAMLAGRNFPRALAAYGIALSAALVAGVMSGQLRLDIHGFGLVVVGEGVWMGWVATCLWRSEVADPERAGAETWPMGTSRSRQARPDSVR